MFTGIVEELGEITAVENLGDACRFRLRGPVVTEGAKHGDSIAVNGVCLTVVDHEGDEFTADVMAETLDRSSLGALAVGSRVNLERPMAVGARLGGHIVQGHVDGTGKVLERKPSEHWEIVKVSLPADLTRYVVEKGSITVDGISLTVVDAGPDYFTVSLIPTTLALTTLGRKQPGDPVNLEVDIVAKYVERLLASGQGRPGELAELRGLHPPRPAHHLVGHDRQHPRPDHPGPRLAALADDLAGAVPLRPGPLHRLLRPPRRQRRQAGRRHGRRPVRLVAVEPRQGPVRRRPHHPAVRHLARARRDDRRRRRRHGRGRPALQGLPVPVLGPWPDAYIFVGTIVAMYAQARGMVEFWIAWLLVDLVGVPLNFANGYAFSGFVYVIYGALVLWGMRDWWLRSRNAARPVLEGAPA